MARYSRNFVGTIGNDETGAAQLAAVRRTISKVNAQLRAKRSIERWRVVAKGRLGRDNPNAPLYRHGGKHWRGSSICIRAEHATRFDLYVYRLWR